MDAHTHTSGFTTRSCTYFVALSSRAGWADSKVKPGELPFPAASPQKPSNLHLQNSRKTEPPPQSPIMRFFPKGKSFHVFVLLPFCSLQKQPRRCLGGERRRLAGLPKAPTSGSPPGKQDQAPWALRGRLLCVEATDLGFLALVMRCTRTQLVSTGAQFLGCVPGVDAGSLHLQKTLWGGETPSGADEDKEMDLVSVFLTHCVCTS